MNRKLNLHQKGFTLIETFVAVLILVFAVIGPLGLLSRAIADGNYAKNQVTAYYLAQEAIELFINHRDYFISLNSPLFSWSNLVGNCEENNPCKILGPTFGGGINVSNCSGESCRLNISNNNIYTHEAGEPSIFRRQIYFTNVEYENSTIVAADMVVEVEWNNKNNIANFTLSTKIIDTSYGI